MKKLHISANVSILLLIGVLVTTFSGVAGSDPPGPQSSAAAAPQSSTADAAAPQSSTADAAAPQSSTAAAAPQSSAPGSAISNMCASTDHKELCHDTLSSSNATDDPIELIKAAFKAVVDHIQNASKIRDDMEKKANDPLNQAALSDCKELLQYAVEELEAAISDVTGKEVHTLGDRVRELLNWLSAVISYTETCKDGIDDPEIKSEMEKGLVNATALTSNALAIVTGIESILSAFHLPNISSIFSRRLLEENSGDVHQIDADGYPTWLSTSDRKLLALNHHGIPNPKPNVVVAQDGSGDFKTISDALNAMPKNSKSRYVIHVKAGLYKENVIVTKDMVNVFMYGDGPRKSIVTGSKNWKDGTPTFQTATFAAIGDGFIAKEMGFQNTAGPEKHQAVALRVQSDMSAFYNCRMDGYQDTLYAQAHRQFYRSCLISGTIDFIFGDSATLLQNCKIVVRKPMDKQFNTVTAQGRKEKNETTGIVLQHCRIIPEEKLYPDRLKVLTYLGRPWKEYSVTVIMESFLDDFIQPEGWKEWDGDFALNTLFYAEYGNEGPGSNTDKRVKWPGVKIIKNRNEAAQYTAEKFVDGNLWLKDTGVPHILSLTK